MAFQRRAGIFCIAALTLSGTLPGCSSVPWFGQDKNPTPPTELTALTAEVTLTPRWSVRPTSGTEGRRLYLVPTLASGRLYVAGASGRVVAVDADSGRTLWQRETGLPFSGGPAVAGERLVLGTTQGELIALAPTDGHELWRRQLGSEVLSVPRFLGTDAIIVHTLDDTLYGIDAASGQERWHVNYPAPVLTLRGSSTPTLTPSGVVVGLSGGKLVKLDPHDGTPLWEVVISRPSGRSELARIADIDADPLLVGDHICVGSYHGDLAAVDAATGAVRWRRELSAYTGLAAAGDNLFITDSQDQLWSADVNTGAGRWKQDGLRYRQLTAPTLVDERLVVGDLEGYLHVLDQRDGRLVGRLRLTKKGGITARPLLVDGRFYIYAEDGTLAAITLQALKSPQPPFFKGNLAAPASPPTPEINNKKTP
jgi:outer membrane protein assembly factor BamB